MKEEYIALFNGKAVMKGTIEAVMMFIRHQESSMDRYTEHSPWTIGLGKGN